jgi:hypothetical protein
MVEILLEALEGTELYNTQLFRDDLEQLISRNILWGPPTEAFNP